MAYELQVEDVTTIRRRLHFTVAPDYIRRELDTAFRDLKRRVRLPGFRAGKVPRNLLEARFGRQIKGEVAGRLIERFYGQAAADLPVAGQPSLEDSSELVKGSDFTFTVEVDVRPEVEIIGYKGVEVAYPVQTISEEQVERSIETRLATRKRIVEIEDGEYAIADGDFVITQLTLTSGEEGEDDIADPGTRITVGSERYYPGVDALLVGLSTGDTAEGEVTIGEDSALENLAGRTFQASAEVLSIQSEQVPELDDEVAADLGFPDGVEQMRLEIRQQLEEVANDAGLNQARVTLLQKIVETNTFEVPEAMIEEQLEALIEELKVRRAYAGEDPRKISFTEGELADLRQRATFAAKASVAIASVSSTEEISVADEDVTAKIDEIASQRGQTSQAIRGYLEREGAVEVLRERIQEEKTMEWLLAQASLAPFDPAAQPPLDPAAQATDDAVQAEPTTDEAEPATADEPEAVETEAAEPAAADATDAAVTEAAVTEAAVTEAAETEAAETEAAE